MHSPLGMPARASLKPEEVRNASRIPGLLKEHFQPLDTLGGQKYPDGLISFTYAQAVQKRRTREREFEATIGQNAGTPAPCW